MAHLLVIQLKFARNEFVRCLEGVSADEACTRVEQLNCLSWMIGHLAEQEQRFAEIEQFMAAVIAKAGPVFAILATLGLLAVQRYVIRRTGSTAIRADALHYRSDLLVNVSIILALVLELRGWSGLDSLFALGIAGYILYSAWHIGHEAFQLLMDRELAPELVEQVRAAALAQPAVRGVHDLRTRRSGQTAFVQQIDDKLQFVHDLVVRNLRLIAGLDQRLESGNDKFGRAPAQYCLLAEQVRLGFLCECRLNDAGASAADSGRVGESFFKRIAGGVPVDRDEARYTVSFLILPAHKTAWTFRSN